MVDNAWTQWGCLSVNALLGSRVKPAPAVSTQFNMFAIMQTLFMTVSYFHQSVPTVTSVFEFLRDYTKLALKAYVRNIKSK